MQRISSSNSLDKKPAAKRTELPNERLPLKKRKVAEELTVQQAGMQVNSEISIADALNLSQSDKALRNLYAMTKKKSGTSILESFETSATSAQNNPTDGKNSDDSRIAPNRDTQEVASLQPQGDVLDNQINYGALLALAKTDSNIIVISKRKKLQKTQGIISFKKSILQKRITFLG
jgi:hypothetical protein